MDLPSPDMIPAIAEPMFQGYEANVEIHPEPWWFKESDFANARVTKFKITTFFLTHKNRCLYWEEFTIIAEVPFVIVSDAQEYWVHLFVLLNL